MAWQSLSGMGPPSSNGGGNGGGGGGDGQGNQPQGTEYTLQGMLDPFLDWERARWFVVEQGERR